MSPVTVPAPEESRGVRTAATQGAGAPSSRRRRLAAVLTAALAMSIVPVALAPSAQAALTQCEAGAYTWGEYPEHGWNVFRGYMPVTNTTSSFTRCQLQRGSSGAGVKALQGALNECHGQSLDVDGLFGAKTQAALIRVQKSLHISADGVFGPTTSYYMSYPGYWEGGYAGPRCM